MEARPSQPPPPPAKNPGGVNVVAPPFAFLVPFRKAEAGEKAVKRSLSRPIPPPPPLIMGGGELVPSEVLPKNTGFNAVFVLILSTKDGVMALEILPKKLTFQH